MEVSLIAYYDSTDENKGYNKSPGGGLQSEETRQKMSESHKDKKLSEETKRKISENNARYWKGMRLSEEIKQKMSDSLKGRQITEEWKQKISESMTGKFVGKNNPKAKSVICITTRQVFLTIKEGAEYYNVNHANISGCCNGKRKSAGKLPDGTKLVWKYLNYQHNKIYRVCS